MKNLKTLLILLISISIITSCSLDRSPETSLSDASFWASEDNFEKACNQFLVSVGAGDVVYADNRSDYATALSLNTISDGSWVTPSTSSDWDQPYQVIFSANKIIEKSELAKFPTINRWIAEARFWRGFAYFQLVKKYGDVPLVLRVLDVDASEFSEGRANRELVIQQVYDDLSYATENLPSFSQLGAKGYGRISKSAALALKSRVALYVGTHQKYHGWGDPSFHLDLAIKSAEAVMSEGHSLYTAKSYYNLFQYDGEGFANSENIFAIVYGQDLANNIRSHNVGRELENGSSALTRAMIEQYLCTDGLPYDKSPLAEKVETSPWSVFKNKDPRMEASIFTEGDPYGNPAEYMWNKASINSRYSPRKYSIVADWSSGNSFVDIAMIRYAEILLIYAEAKFEKEGYISEVDLDKSINLIRNRVSMPRLTNSFVTANGLDMKTELRRERAVELAQEGFRYDDIIRWKIAEIVLPKRLTGATFFGDIYKGSVNITEDNFILVQKASARSFDPQKDYLYPVPVREIALSGEAISQNPNW